MKKLSNVPNVLTPLGFLQQAATISYRNKDGSHSPVRPIGFWGLCLRRRLKAAWMVFTGQWDAMDWQEKKS